MKRYLVFAVMMIPVLSCSLVTGTRDSSSEPNTCYSEQNLTEEECDNAGTHSYSSSGSTEGFGGFECGFEDGSTYFQETTRVTIQFPSDGRMLLDHPGESVWGVTSHTFRRTSENAYLYEGELEDGVTSWTITFEWWGYQEEMLLTYDCDGMDCGCRTTFENRLE